MPDEAWGWPKPDQLQKEGRYWCGKYLIVSRHPAAVEFCRRYPQFRDAEVLATATAEQVAGARVAGNLPLHLAALAYRVYAIEFSGPPPRGAEYTLEDMDAAGAHLRAYQVLRTALADPQAE